MQDWSARYETGKWDGITCVCDQILVICNMRLRLMCVCYFNQFSGNNFLAKKAKSDRDPTWVTVESGSKTAAGVEYKTLFAPRNDIT